MYNGRKAPCVSCYYDDDDDDDDEIAYFTVRWKPETSFSVPHQKRNKTDKHSKNRKRSH